VPTSGQRPGTDVMIKKYFCPKNWQKVCVFDSMQIWIMLTFDHNIGFWEKRQFFIAENGGKSQKIVI
jgi:hypothetical protein